jgi:hypothetical protein
LAGLFQLPPALLVQTRFAAGRKVGKTASHERKIVGRQRRKRIARADNLAEIMVAGLIMWMVFCTSNNVKPIPEKVIQRFKRRVPRQQQLFAFAQRIAVIF